MSRPIALFAAVTTGLMSYCGCTSNLPPLPEVDTSRFEPQVKTLIDGALSEARAQPGDHSTVSRLCLSLHAHEQFRAAVQCYSRLHKLDSRSFAALYRWGHALASLGDYAGAENRLREAQRIEPQSEAAALKLAEVLRGKGDLVASAGEARKVLAANPKSAAAHYALGRTQQGDDASASYAKAIELFPRYGAARFALATLYRRTGRESEAVELLRDYERDKTLIPPMNDPAMAAIRELSVGAAALLQRAAEQEMEGRLDESIALYRQAISADPKQASAWADLVSLYGRKGQIREAEEAYRQAIGVDRGYAGAYYNFGVLCYQQKRFSEAREAFDQAVQLAPGHAEALHNLGALFEQGGSLDKAEAMYRRALAARPAYPLARFHLGRIYANQRRYKLAVAELEKSLEPATDSTPSYLYALAATHARAGNRARAVELLRDARAQAEARGQQTVIVSINRDLAKLERTP